MLNQIQAKLGRSVPLKRIKSLVIRRNINKIFLVIYLAVKQRISAAIREAQNPALATARNSRATQSTILHGRATAIPLQAWVTYSL